MERSELVKRVSFVCSFIVINQIIRGIEGYEQR